MKPAVTLFLASALLFSRSAAAVEFISGRPVWPEELEKEKNLFVGFRAVFPAPEDGQVILRVAASSVYRFFVNGNFAGHGPARGPHGYYRVDEWDLSEKILPGKNLLAVEVAGYNINSYYLLDQPAFLQAEVLAEEKILVSTGGAVPAFEACILEERTRKVQRYSYQRTFCEVYRLRPGYDRWRKEIAAGFQPAACAVFPGKKLLPRRVPYPDFRLRRPVRHVSRGKIKTGVKPDKIWRDRSLTDIGPELGGFREKELEVVPSAELQEIANLEETRVDRQLSPAEKLRIERNSYHILDLGTNLTGFIGAKLTVHKPTRLFITFDEILSSGDVDFKRLNCVNAVTYDLPEGVYQIESFEPYTLKFIKLIVVEGDCTLEDIYLREYVNPEAGRAQFACSDHRLEQLFAAGRETFRQNALDIFMDCPSRERAGWLCDSYFTARAAFDLCGNAAIEKNFFENYLLPRGFANLPEGMLPMCYPADHNKGTFIPNWALWFVLQLEEYAARSGDRHTLEAARPAVMKLFDYFEKFVNGEGLLDQLESWVFIEWSEANDFVQDVNYPTNMLYAAALEAAGRLYGMPGLSARAEKVRRLVREQSFDGKFFVDNAVRKFGKLRPTRNRTEVCQYFAFFTDTATPQSHPELWRKLIEQFGPKRGETGAFEEVHRARPFIGNMLRLELLSRYGRCGQVLEESTGYYLEMAERTGTLWEFEGARASCNHGFASHIVRILFRDILGLYQVNPLEKKIELRFSDLELDRCEGRIPTPGGPVFLEWWKEGRDIHYRTEVPGGFSVNVENLSSGELIRAP